MSQLSPTLTSAARLLGAGEPRIVGSIVAPLVRVTVLSTFFLAFTQTVFELPASMLLYPPGAPTFSVVAQVQFSAFNWPLGSAIAIIGMTVVLASYAVGRKALGYAEPAGASPASSASPLSANRGW
jgi:iron(III) transport system permease protein